MCWAGSFPYSLLCSIERLLSMLAFALLLASWRKSGNRDLRLFVAFDVIDMICASPSLISPKTTHKSKAFSKNGGVSGGGGGVLNSYDGRQHLLYKWTLSRTPSLRTYQTNLLFTSRMPIFIGATLISLQHTYVMTTGTRLPHSPLEGSAQRYPCYRATSLYGV